MEAELRLYNLRHLTLLQLRQGIGKGLHKARQRCRLELTTLNGRAIHRVHTRQCGKAGLARHDTLTHIDKTLTGAELRLLDILGEHRNLCILILLGNDGETILILRVVESLHLARHNLGLLDNGLLHHLCVGLLLELTAQEVTNVVDCHMRPLLECRYRACIVDHRLHLLLDSLRHIALADLDRVEQSLIEEQLLEHKLLECLILCRTVRGITLRATLLEKHLGSLLNIGVADRGVTHHCHHLVEHHKAFLRHHSRCTHNSQADKY